MDSPYLLLSRFSLILFTSAVVLTSCIKDDVSTPIAEQNDLAGGETTIFSSGPDAFTFPLANLDEAGLVEHFEADGAFEQQFVTAPANQFAGVGPIFNQNSCVSCHIRNGRGSIAQFEGDPENALLLRLSLPGIGGNSGVVPVPGFGSQLQTKAIFGIEAEGTITKSTIDIIHEYADGMQVILQKPTYGISDPYTALPIDILISPRNAPPVHGLGLLEAIPEYALLELEDENDQNGDGVSGKGNIVWDVLEETYKRGRFGWKAEQPTARQQAADAAHNDMGLTNYFFPTEHCDGQSNCTEGLQTEMDVDEETTDLFAFYFQTLAVPAQRNQGQEAVIAGKSLFNQVKCNSCHTPRHQTGTHPISALSDQEIYPYTDLLLHDMGEGLADNRPSFSANGSEWRTPPLWGIGLTKIVNSNGTFLHDGRAETIEEAILWHGGEAVVSKNMFSDLSNSNREKLLSFLHSL